MPDGIRVSGAPLFLPRLSKIIATDSAPVTTKYFVMAGRPPERSQPSKEIELVASSLSTFS